MRKLLLLALVTVIMVGCMKHEIVPDTKQLEYEGWVVVEIDSCEYIGTKASRMRDFFAHKGNCRFCAESRKLKS